MYLVELAPGKETIYHDEHEFTDAILRGEVSAQSRIYHRAKSVWISVTFHPQFRRVATARPPQPMPPLQRAEWTFFRADAPEKRPTVPDPALSEVTPTAPPARPSRSWRKTFEGLIGHH